MADLELITGTWRLTTEVRATEVKLGKVERVGKHLSTTIQLTVGNIERSQLYELGHLIEGGPMDVKLMSCQLGLGM